MRKLLFGVPCFDEEDDESEDEVDEAAVFVSKC